MDNALDLTLADDTFDDDCTCPQDCEHELAVIDGEWKLPCDRACPVHGGLD
jgi:uncharacterized Zn finger protein